MTKIYTVLMVMAAFVSIIQGQIQQIGKCPRDIPTYEKVHQKKLDTQKLGGYWKSVYDIQEDEDTQGHTCPTIKINPGYNSTNATMVELLQGSKTPEKTEFKIVDPESGNPIEIKESRVLYDDSVLLIFNHPSDSSTATIQPKNAKSKEETKAEYLAQYEQAPLSAEERVLLTTKELQEYEAEQVKIRELQQRVIQLVDEYDPYDAGMVIVDTDFDNYLLTYNCQEEFSYDFDVEESHIDYEIIKEAEAFIQLMDHTDEFLRFQESMKEKQHPNINLQQEIEELQALAKEKFVAHFKDGLTADDWQELRKYYLLNDHVQKWQITLYARNTDKYPYFHAQNEDILQLVQKHFPKHDFGATHEPLDHSSCPTGDIFKDAQSYAEVEQEEERYLDRAEEIYGTEEEYDEAMDEDVDMDEVQKLVDDMMNNALKEDL